MALVGHGNSVALMPSSAPTIKLSYCTAVNLMVATLRASEHARESAPDYLKLMHTWFTLTHATFTLEAVANSLLAQVNLPPDEWAKKERLQLPDKLDFLVHTKHGTHIDRQDITYRKMNEMISLRNYHVHPKVKDKRFTLSSSLQTRSHVVTLVDDITQYLRIPFNHMGWKPEHANVFAKLMIEVMNKLFISDLRMTPRECEQSLCTTFSSDSGVQFLTPADLDLVQVKFEQEHGYQFHFLRPAGQKN